MPPHNARVVRAGVLYALVGAVGVLVGYHLPAVLAAAGLEAVVRPLRLVVTALVVALGAGMVIEWIWRTDDERTPHA